jgi:hypothetical protein
MFASAESTVFGCSRSAAVTVVEPVDKLREESAPTEGPAEGCCPRREVCSS